MFSDLRFAFRVLAKSPGFTAVAVLSLALGIGANTAIFSLINQVLLRPLPVKNPAELVALSHDGPIYGMNIGAGAFSHPMYRDLEQQNHVLAGLVASFATTVNLAYAGAVERAEVQLVSGNYFEVLGVGTVLGRPLTRADDDTPDGHPVAVLSHDYWTRRFGADPAILDRKITINGYPFAVIGVAAAGFRGTEFGRACDVMVPLMMKAQVTPTWNDLTRRRSLWLHVVGRLKPGVGLEQAHSALVALYQSILAGEVNEVSSLSAADRKEFVSHRISLVPTGMGSSEITKSSQMSLVFVMSLAGLVLLIACANVASLLVARSAARQKEIAVRLALGAGRWRIARQMFLESGVLAMAGGALGLLVALWTVEALVALLPENNSPGGWLNPELEPRVLFFALGVSLLAALLFGLAPAWFRARTSLVEAINNQATAVAGGRGLRLVFQVLVAGQLALSLLLLITCALFAGSLYQLYRVDPGFPVQRLVAFSVDASTCGYKGANVTALYQRLQERLAALPGVASASISRYGVLRSSSWRNTVRFEGSSETPAPRTDFTGPGLFATLGIPVLLGREFTERDIRGAPAVALINEAVSKRYFPGQNPVGRHIYFGGDAKGVPDVEIVGIVKTANAEDIREEPREFVYRPLLQADGVGEVTFYLRTATAPDTLAGLIRAAVKDLEPNLAIYRLTTVQRDVDDQLTRNRGMALLTTAFGLLATALAAIGLYGVLAYTVARRTREIGIRIALGADPANVSRLVLRDVARLTAIGAAIALPAAYGLGRLVQSLLYGVSGFEPALGVAATVFLALVALAAGWLPARRAARVNPVEALRAE